MNLSLLVQSMRVLSVNLRTIPLRLGNSLVIVIGVAGVVAVLIATLAMSSGFRTTIRSDGRADRAIAFTRGATEEYESSLARETVATLSNLAGIKHDATGTPMLSAEVVMATPVSRKRDRSDVNITLRGVGPQYFAMRPELKLIAGRMFRTGMHEIVVGAAARAQFSGLDLEDEVRAQDGDWKVVGVFAGASGARESELVADAQAVLSAYKSNTYNSVTIMLDSENSLPNLRDALAKQAELFIDVQSEPDYLESASRPLKQILNTVAIVIGSIMSLGALFGALNSMHSAVAARSVEIATMRALGFDSGAVLLATLLESLLLALIGAAVGTAIAYEAIDGAIISTIGGAIWDSQLVYALKITPSIIGYSVLLACMLGLLGGATPAFRASRANVAESLRQS